MKSSLKERFARLGPVQAVTLTGSGSPADLVLRPNGKRLKPVQAVTALAQRGLTLLRAKRAFELMAERGEAVVRLPTVESLPALASELAAAGVKAASLSSAVINVKALRQSLQMTQEQFALTYGFELDAVQNWEQGRRVPDRATVGYLRVIARLPREAAEAQEEAPL